MDIKENVLLAPYTTFQIGGPARFFSAAQSIEDIQLGLKFATEKALPVFILGGGSNLLINDTGFEGMVIKIELKRVEIEEEEKEGKKVVIAAAGEGWDKLVERCVAEKLWGIENLSGIPGTVGGAVVQNIGAYGAAVSETLVWVEALDASTGEIKKFSNVECMFDYRDSIFKHKPDFIVLRAAFALSRSPKPKIAYKDLASFFNDSSVDMCAVRTAVLNIRKAKFPDLAVEGTAGSFFKNPILAGDDAQALKEKYPDMPLFAMPETTGVKVPIAWLMDHVLHMHGFAIGGARLYEKQILVIAAARNTPSVDVKTLVEKVKKEVQERVKIKIEEEVKIV